MAWAFKIAGKENERRIIQPKPIGGAEVEEEDKEREAEEEGEVEGDYSPFPTIGVLSKDSLASNHGDKSKMSKDTFVQNIFSWDALLEGNIAQLQRNIYDVHRIDKSMKYILIKELLNINHIR